MQELDECACRNLFAAIILQACKDYLNNYTCHDVRSPRRYFLSPEYEFHSSVVHFRVTGEELMDLLDSGKITINNLQYESYGDPTR